MNDLELKAEMIRQKKTPDDMCAAAGISRTSWYRKLYGKSQFTLGEIAAIRDALGLSDQQVTAIFFSQKVS